MFAEGLEKSVEALLVERLPSSTCEWVDDNEGAVLRDSLVLPAAWKHPIGLLGNWDSHRWQCSQIALNRMLVIPDGHSVCVEKPSSLAGVGQPPDALGCAESGHQTASQEALKVESGIRSDIPQAAAPSEETENAERTPELGSRKLMCCGEGGVVFEKWRPTWVNDPSDASIWPCLLDSTCHGKSVDDVTHRSRLDEKETFRWRLREFAHDGPNKISGLSRGVSRVFREVQRQEWQLGLPGYRIPLVAIPLLGVRYRRCNRRSASRNPGVGRRFRH